MKTRFLLPVLLALGCAAYAQDAEKKPLSMEQLLEKVKSGWQKDQAEAQRREQEFIAARDQQKKLLDAARARLEAAKKRAEELEKEFDINEAEITRLEQTLQQKLGTMGELFGVIRQMAGDARAQLKSSLVSAQLPGREKEIEPLTSSKGLPTIEQLRTLWYLLQQEMVETGKVVRFDAQYIDANGEKKTARVVRVGPFTAIADGKYLDWDIKADNPELKLLSRQPSAIFLDSVRDLEQARQGFVRFAIDPSEGQILSLLVDTPTFKEHIAFGGPVGYTIIVLGLLALAGALIRLVYLAVVSLMVRRQRSRSSISRRNPLGRILAIAEENKTLDVSVLEQKLDEAILRESSKLNRYLWVVAIISTVAPLLGLLGTITGMIRVFQDIMLMGTGDPRIMAGGISEALVTTEEGLVFAIPLVLLHGFLRSMAHGVAEILEQQSLGLVARRREEACRDGQAAN